MTINHKKNNLAEIYCDSNICCQNPNQNKYTSLKTGSPSKSKAQRLSRDEVFDYCMVVQQKQLAHFVQVFNTMIRSEIVILK